MKWDHSPTGIAILGDMPWARLLFYSTAFFWFVKNVVNVVQLWKASKILVGVDLAERAKQREEAEMQKRVKEKENGNGNGNGK